MWAAATVKNKIHNLNKNWSRLKITTAKLVATTFSICADYSKPRTAQKPLSTQKSFENLRSLVSPVFILTTPRETNATRT